MILKMPVLNKSTLIIIFFLSLAYQAFPTNKSDKEEFVIGFSQCTSNDDWRKYMELEMKNELLYYPKLQLVIKDAQNSSKTQISDIQDFLNMGIDLLIVSPNESEPLSQIVSEVFKKGLPIIIIDRKIESDDYTAYIGANNYLIGREAGKYAARLLKGKGKIVEIWGLKGSSPAQDRHKGFIEEIEKFPEISIIYSLSGEWEYKGGVKVMENIINMNSTFDLVFAHNDFMALGAYKAYIDKFKEKKSFFYRCGRNARSRWRYSGSYG